MELTFFRVSTLLVDVLQFEDIDKLCYWFTSLKETDLRGFEIVLELPKALPEASLYLKEVLCCF